MAKISLYNFRTGRVTLRRKRAKNMLTEKEQKEYLLSKIGNTVHFKYPEPPHDRYGKLLDRFVVKDRVDVDKVTYWNIIDLIEFDNEEEQWLRMTYYRYKKKEQKWNWNFAGQTSFANPISKFEELFVNALKEKEWVRPLFKETFRQCKKELE